MKSDKRCILICFLVLVFIGCGKVPVQEQGRVSNPKGAVDAVLAIKLTDATVATPTEVYLVAKGVAELNTAVFRADHVSNDAKLEWTSETEVTFSARQARVFLRETSATINTSKGKAQIQIKYEIENEQIP